MKKIINVFFVVLGVVFFIVILGTVVFFIVDPFNLKPLLFSSSEYSASPYGNTTDQTEVETDKNPALSPAQEKALETVGIAPEALPSSITPAQEACFTEKLGAERVAQIKAGDSPSATEIFKAKACIQ